jgi:hypothetical protein
VTADHDRKTAALSSRSAVMAAVLLAVAIMAMAVAMQSCEADDGDGANGPVIEGSVAPDP